MSLLNKDRLVQLMASKGKVFQSKVAEQINEYLKWLVRANGILNLLQEDCDLSLEDDNKEGRELGGKYTRLFFILNRVTRERKERRSWRDWRWANWQSSW